MTCSQMGHFRYEKKKRVNEERQVSVTRRKRSQRQAAGEGGGGRQAAGGGERSAMNDKLAHAKKRVINTGINNHQKRKIKQTILISLSSVTLSNVTSLGVAN